MQHPTSRDELKSAIRGRWTSISTELRPTEDRTGSGKITPTYLTRDFEYAAADKFVGRIKLFSDPFGAVPLMEFEFRGHLQWGPPHPVASGAWTVDYVLDEGFGVTPLHVQAAAMLNAVPVPDLEPFAEGVRQEILKKAFPMFNIVAGQIVVDYDLLYCRNEMLFFGAKHVDGTPFDKPERRPSQLQVPLVRF